MPAEVLPNQTQNSARPYKLPDQVKRAQEYEQRKQDKIRQKQFQKEQEELAECEFEPDIYQSRVPGINDTQRDLYDFLGDQQQFLQNKHEKIEEKKLLQIGKELDQVYHEPKLDDLSVAIVEQMEDRQGVPTHERLYKKGQE